MNTISLSLPEILALIGLIQCVYLIVYVAFRTRLILHAGLPLLYFIVLGAAFLSDLGAARIEMAGDLYFFIQWALWFMGPPLSVLLVIQLADMSRFPPLRDFWVLLLLPLSFMLTRLALEAGNGCSAAPCQELRDMLTVTGLMAGTISLLVIFSKKDLLKNLIKQKHGRERYWLIFSLISLNTCFLCIMLLGLADHVEYMETVLLRNILGIGFVYLVSTSLLVLYPQAGKSGSAIAAETLSPEEQGLAEKIEKLLLYDKVYQEPTYSRANLAQECGVSETMVSRVINVHFQKSFPQLINERRIDDAKRLLLETEASVKTVAENVGFNSLPSFNRVFKDFTGQAPSQFRKKPLKT